MNICPDCGSASVYPSAPDGFRCAVCGCAFGAPMREKTADSNRRFREGREAARAGQSIESCPHKAVGDRREWQAGFRSQLSVARKQNTRGRTRT